MPTCFVMQPFDGAAFDRRFEEVFKPAIEAADLEAYCVDKDPGVSIPIEQIESGIRDAQICLADITLDKPNVWFELGFAIACRKQVVLVCSDERESQKFPFDVQHRSIIKYPTKSPSDYKVLERNITEKLRALIAKTENLAAVSEASILAKFDGLDQHEVMAIATIAQNLNHDEDSAAVHQIRRDMEASGFTNLATTIALRRLQAQGFVSGAWEEGYQSEPFYCYKLTPYGWSWVLSNKEKFALEKERKSPGYGYGSPPRPAPRPPTRAPQAAPKSSGFDDMDDDIPF